VLKERNKKYIVEIVLESEKIWHWNKVGFRFANCEITI
jgi:hypothetical protein